jgi:hypothetical protein
LLFEIEKPVGIAIAKVATVTVVKIKHQQLTK